TVYKSETICSDIGRIPTKEDSTMESRTLSENYIKKFLKQKKSNESLIIETSKNSQIKTFTTELFSNLFTPIYQRRNYTKIKKVKLNKNSFDSYRISLLFYCRPINNNFSQSLLPTPNENHIMILHYSDYSASEMEFLFYHYMLKDQKKHGKKYKTIKEIEESSTKELTTNNEPFDYHSQKDIDGAKLNRNPFDSKYNKNYRIFLFRSIYDNFSHENHMHNGDYSASKMEILFYRYILKSQKKHDKKYKIIKENEESSKKEPTNNEPFDNHSQKGLNENKMEKLQFIQSLSFYRFNKSINEIKELQDTIENIKLQLKELKGLVEVSVKELEGDNRISEIQQGINIAKEKLKEYKDLNCLFHNGRNEIANLKDEI
ncbi:12051_t:CDS:1, partial [Gigaspora rosea]